MELHAYFVNISNASSSYDNLCSGVRDSRVSSLMKALEQVPNALQAEAAKAVKQYSAQIREAFRCNWYLVYEPWHFHFEELIICWRIKHSLVLL